MRASFRSFGIRTYATRRCSTNVRRHPVREVAEEDVWLVDKGTQPGRLAAALFNRPFLQAASDDSNGGGKKIVLEAMGPSAVGKALSGLALCNRFLDDRDRKAVSKVASPRVAFIPERRVFVHRETEQQNLGDVRRSVRFSISTAAVGAAPGDALQKSDGMQTDDLIRVAASTDVERLAGLIHSRWSRSAGLPKEGAAPVALQARGHSSINAMVRALAFAWNRSVAENIDWDDEAPGDGGFRCLPLCIGPPGEVIGIECRLLHAA
eukprot:TRINITY_DN58380_c0_g1_i1.p1 TRINITY_DN58380_c0_g1~~TRINITY_DN58380_c0_g1_i1.p1  ORF type:complete len:265 (-),score=41.79 TRINITY_DN58380_c0_g1_i1:334-1128(-)